MERDRHSILLQMPSKHLGYIDSESGYLLSDVNQMQDGRLYVSTVEHS